MSGKIFMDLGSRNTARDMAAAAREVDEMLPDSPPIAPVPDAGVIDLLKSHQLEKYEFDYDSIDKEIWPGQTAERCRKWGVHPGVFDHQATFDRVYIWQVMPFNLDYKDGFWCLPGTTISLPPKALERDRNLAPRGILLSAGLEAMDELATNGIRIGDYVDFLRLTPFRKAIGVDAGLSPVTVVMCSASDIIGSEDLATRRKAGKFKMTWKREKLPGGGEFVGHSYEGEGIPEGCPPLRAEKREDL